MYRFVWQRQSDYQFANLILTISKFLSRARRKRVAWFIRFLTKAETI